MMRVFFLRLLIILFSLSLSWIVTAKAPADDDLDRVPNGGDNCPLVSNRDQRDSDRDGVGDLCDNCRNHINTDQLNSDSDALGNACDKDDDNDGTTDRNDCSPLSADGEVTIVDSSGGSSCVVDDDDDDNDGVTDRADCAPRDARTAVFITNESAPRRCVADDEDDDDDGTPDALDCKPRSTFGEIQITDASRRRNCVIDDDDDDNDFRADAEDNCPLLFNSDQINTDGDTEGDACDTDDDNDGRVDTADLCPLDPDDLIGNPCNHNDCSDRSPRDAVGDACIHNDCADLTLEDLIGNPCNHTDCPDRSPQDSVGNSCNHDDDGDGLSDISDNCPLLANPGQGNNDNDGAGDVCDLDDDNDFRIDTEDNCLLLFNSDQINTDGDTEGDACDTDDDNDGIADATDNCPLVANGLHLDNQADADGDGQGDLCDDDDDGDGIADNSDNCRLLTNSDQINTDGNSFGNACWSGFLSQTGGSNGHPDTHGAVGPNHVVSIANSSTTRGLFLVQDKEGNPVLSRTQTSFWNEGLGLSRDGSIDSRIYFDHLSQRWIASTLLGRGFALAVSATDDPTGTWYFGAHYTTGGIDFPVVGINRNWIVVWANSRLHIFNKNAVMNNDWPASPISFFTSSLGALHPVITYDPEEPDLYFVDSAYRYEDPPRLGLSKISGPIDSPTFSSVAVLPDVQEVGLLAYNDIDAPQRGTPTQVNISESQIQTAPVFRNGRIWVSLQTAMPTSRPRLRATISWFEIDPTATPARVVQAGLIDSPGMFYYYPSIAVDVNNNVALGFSGSSVDSYIGAYYAIHKNTDPPGVVSSLVQYKEGEATYSAYPGWRGTWGDYSATTVDPSEPNVFWTIQQYAKSAAAPLPIPEGCGRTVCWGMQWLKFMSP